MNLLRNFFMYVRLALVICCFGPLLCISFIFFWPVATALIIHYGSKAIIWSLGIKVSIHGSYPKNIGPAIIVANHQSLLDIPLIAAALPVIAHQWLYKHELDATPCIGWLFKKIGISVGRLSFKDGMQVLRAVCKKAQEYPYSFIIFPEGARFVNKGVQEFIPGFGLLAQKLSCSVQPIYIHNAGRVCPPGCFSVDYIPVKINIGPTFTLKTHQSIKEFVDNIRLWFLEQEQACALD